MPLQTVRLQDQREQSRRQQTQSSCPCSYSQSGWRQWHCSHAKWMHAFDIMAIFHFLLKLHSLGIIKDFSRNPNNSIKTEFAFEELQGWRSKTCCSDFAYENDDYLVLNMWWWIGGYFYYDWHHMSKNVFDANKFTVSFCWATSLQRPLRPLLLVE